MVPSRRFEIAMQCDFLDPKTIGGVADQILDRLGSSLEIGLDNWQPAKVFVRDGPNCMVDREIHVSPKRSGKRLSANDWFELLFAHELTHLLIAEAWGIAPVLFWEGVPVFMADNFTRSRVLGTTYHECSRALLENERLLPLSELLLPRSYHARRTDSRVDIQAGSFSGYLLQSFGVGPMRALATDYVAPSAEVPRMLLTPLLKRHFDSDLPGLEAKWTHFLETEVACRSALVEQLSGSKTTRGAVPPLRCNFCGHRLNQSQLACSSCGIDAEIVIEIE